MSKTDQPEDGTCSSSVDPSVLAVLLSQFLVNCRPFSLIAHVFSCVANNHAMQSLPENIDTSNPKILNMKCTATVSLFLLRLVNKIF